MKTDVLRINPVDIQPELQLSTLRKMLELYWERNKTFPTVIELPINAYLYYLFLLLHPEGQHIDMYTYNGILLRPYTP